MLEVWHINPKATNREGTVNIGEKDGEVGAGRQEAERKNKAETCGCGERGPEEEAQSKDTFRLLSGDCYTHRSKQFVQLNGVDLFFFERAI